MQMDTATFQSTTADNSSFMPSVDQQRRRIISPPPNMDLPFPPQIVPEDLMNCKTRKLPSKPPNAFFIYRKVYTKELIKRNLRFKMTDVSPWVSISWKREPEDVKNKYKEIAKEVRKLYKKSKLVPDQSENNAQSSMLPSPPLTDTQFSTPELSQDSLFYSLMNHSGLRTPEETDFDVFDNTSMNLVQLSNPLGFTMLSDVADSTLWQGDNFCQELPSNIYNNVNSELAFSEYSEYFEPIQTFEYSQYSETQQQSDIGQAWTYENYLFDNIPLEWGNQY
ncbi:19027_t:CDS:1 [Dentiscutata erythropus]|uniref:19027_t:CDS:1 n=1 Tax=Dentiscutata erythropus TaxID=1348616 RepID=A0A9N9E4J1_9GLOM|nr:19027_t:CDS:1 [Dentiscutata erythropus]